MGMSLRDYFAAQALGPYLVFHASRVPQWSPEEVAESVYLVADAMLAERQK